MLNKEQWMTQELSKLADDLYLLERDKHLHATINGTPYQAPSRDELMQRIMAAQVKKEAVHDQVKKRSVFSQSATLFGGDKSKPSILPSKTDTPKTPRTR